MSARYQLVKWIYPDVMASSAERFVPGDPSLWKVIEDGVGGLGFSYAEGLLIDWGDVKPALTESMALDLFSFSGITETAVVSSEDSLAIHVRAKSKIADDVSSVFLLYLATHQIPVPRLLQKVQVINVRPGDASPDKFDALQNSLLKLVQFGSKSGLFDPFFQEARVVGPGDTLGWEFSTGDDEENSFSFLEHVRITRRHPLSAKYVIKETGSKFKDGDVINTVSPLEILGTHKGAPAYQVRRGFDPLTLILGLQARYSAHYSKIVHRSLEMITGFRERGVSLAYATELYPFASFVEIFDGFRETYIKSFDSTSSKAFLYLSRPFDSRNGFETRKIERFCRKLEAISGVNLHVFSLEYGLCLSLARLAAKEVGIMLFEVALKQVIQWERLHTGYERCLLIWVSDEAKRDVEKLAKLYDVSTLVTGQRHERPYLSIVSEKDEIQDIPVADLMAAVQAQSDAAVMGTWTYEEDRRPAYGFERANVYPDRFLKRSTQKNKLEMEVGNLLSSYFVGDLSRISLQRGSFSYPLGALRWSDGQQTCIEAGGQTRGISKINPRLTGVVLVDDAVRWLLSQGALPMGALGAVYVSMPGAELQGLSSKQRAMLSLAFDGIMSACKDFGIRVTNVRYSPHSGPAQQFELIFRVTSPVDPKKNFIIPGFRIEDEVLYAVGPKPPFVDAGSKILPYVRVVSNNVTELSLGDQLMLYKLISACMDESLVASMRPVSYGGLAEALGEMALWSGLGAKIRPSVPTIELFSGAPGRFVIGVLPQNVKAFEAIIPSEMYTNLGTSGGKKVLSLPLDELFESRKELANPREEVV